MALILDYHNFLRSIVFFVQTLVLFNYILMNIRLHLLQASIFHNYQQYDFIINKKNILA